MKDKIIIFIIVLLLLLGLKVISSAGKGINQLILGGKTFQIEVADNDFSREKGLSGHKPLLGNEGMLFIFEKEGDYGFWMKDMLFPIDIIWIDKNFRITHIEKSVLPETYPQVLHSPSPSLYVLEISAGEAEKLNLKTGDGVNFLKK